MLTTTIEVEVNRYESPERDVYGSIPTRQVRDTITLPLSAYYFSSAVVNDSRKMEESRILKGFSPVRTLSDRVRLGDHVHIEGRAYAITGITDYSPSPFSVDLPSWFGSSFDAEYSGEVMTDGNA